MRTQWYTEREVSPRRASVDARPSAVAAVRNRRSCIDTNACRVRAQAHKSNASASRLAVPTCQGLAHEVGRPERFGYLGRPQHQITSLGLARGATRSRVVSGQARAAAAVSNLVSWRRTHLRGRPPLCPGPSLAVPLRPGAAVCAAYMGCMREGSVGVNGSTDRVAMTDPPQTEGPSPMDHESLAITPPAAIDGVANPSRPARPSHGAASLTRWRRRERVLAHRRRQSGAWSARRAWVVRAQRMLARRRSVRRRPGRIG
jgi:hypothetical protein